MLYNIMKTTDCCSTLNQVPVDLVESIYPAKQQNNEKED